MIEITATTALADIQSTVDAGQPPITLKNPGAYAQAKSDKKKKKPAGDDLGPPPE